MPVLLQALGTGCSGLLVVLRAPDGAQGSWWCSRSRQAHAMNCFASNPPSPAGFCLGNVHLATQILMAPGGIAQVREDAPEGALWHSPAMAFAPRDTQTHRPWTSGDVKKDLTCSRLTRARDEPHWGDPGRAHGAAPGPGRCSGHPGHSSIPSVIASHHLLLQIVPETGSG